MDRNSLTLADSAAGLLGPVLAENAPRFVVAAEPPAGPAVRKIGWVLARLSCLQLLPTAIFLAMPLQMLAPNINNRI